MDTLQKLTYKKYYLLFLAIGISFFLCGKSMAASPPTPPTPPPPTSGTLSGYITDSSTHLPIYAMVRAESPIGISWSTSTNHRGFYSLSVLTGYTLTVTASSPGYNSSSKSITIPSGTSSTTCNLTLTPLTRCTVSGKVIDQASKPISGANVRINGMGATTNASGNYSISGLFGGSTYSATASKANYNTVTKSISIPPGSTSYTCNFQLTLITPPTRCTLYGKVTDTRNNPLDMAFITIYQGPTTVATVRTLSDGSYSYTLLAPNITYDVTAAKPYYTPRNTTVTFTPPTTRIKRDFQLPGPYYPRPYSSLTATDATNQFNNQVLLEIAIPLRQTNPDGTITLLATVKINENNKDAISYFVFRGSKEEADTYQEQLQLLLNLAGDKTKRNELYPALGNIFNDESSYSVKVKAGIAELLPLIAKQLQSEEIPSLLRDILGWLTFYSKLRTETELVQAKDEAAKEALDNLRLLKDNLILSFHQIDYLGVGTDSLARLQKLLAILNTRDFMNLQTLQWVIGELPNVLSHSAYMEGARNAVDAALQNILQTNITE